ncbi:L,D-transpeptidase family protein [Pseudonocardia sp. KRD-184]|uniref:L,D-transpeptidase family protein n=1 Tax=Pseudonocardia oceani TaxID=2792013 RepID=A0ABS6UIK7_9PSEU|nr:L,D-transpeptidase [Pseudonocardia oceani]MBW0097028.1 L,D-transpeptidase family protein [Pseudonocardia oceani]MBW0112556.1 L,D-transpeptidase family protein [Pseudonocardia oceani]MBW0125069.1 L,D-transpeptidase family protein [Pseudonocardia oceani]MBW0132087.1 L,D-transpeptidase family protein [Pseudonocardia oceani]
MAAQPQCARRIAIGAALAAVLSTVLFGVGFGVGTAEEGPVAVPVSQAAPRAVPALPAEPAPRAAREEPAQPPAPGPTTAVTTPEPTPTEEPAPTAPSRERAGVNASVPVRAPAPAALVPGTPCTVTARACVDLAGRTSWLIKDGVVSRGPVPVMIGDEIDPTPRGTFAVEWKAEQWTSREYLTQMPYAVFFAEGGIAFHEGPQDTSSAGCVKLSHENAMAWFEYLQVGDQVQIR